MRHPLCASSFFQSLCILGYCVFPLDISAMVNVLMGLMGFSNFVVKTFIVAIGFVWSTRGEWRTPMSRTLRAGGCCKTSSHKDVKPSGHFVTVSQVAYTPSIQ